MKNLIALASLVVLAINVSAQSGVKWMSWNEAVEAAKEEPKLIFVDTYNDWCGWCKKMDKSTFANPIIAEYMNEHYYAVKMDAEMKDTIDFNGHTFVNPRPNTKRSTHELAASLLDNRLSYPSFVFLNADFQRIQILPGYKTARQFEPIIRYFVEGASAGVTYEDYMAEFNSLFPPKPTPAN